VRVDEVVPTVVRGQPVRRRQVYAHRPFGIADCRAVEAGILPVIRCFGETDD
jgi:hypothetical protein